jgi:hypothetical protein
MRGQTAIATAVVAGLEFAWLCTLLHTASEGLRVAVSAPLLFVIYAASFAVALGLRANASLVSYRRGDFMACLAACDPFPAHDPLLNPDVGPMGGSWGAAVLQAFDGIAHEFEAAIFIVPAAAILCGLDAA